MLSHMNHADSIKIRETYRSPSENHSGDPEEAVPRARYLNNMARRAQSDTEPTLYVPRRAEGTATSYTSRRAGSTATSHTS